MNYLRWSLLSALLFISTLVSAQSVQGDVEGLWVLGASMSVSDRTKLFVLGAHDNRLNANAAMVMGMINLNKNISLSPAYTFVDVPPVNGFRYQEHSILGSASFSLPLKHFVVDDRNMIQQRFRRNLSDLTFYRNRLRVTYSTKIKKMPFRLFAFDEVYYDATGGIWNRNRWSGGTAIFLFGFLYSECAYVRETNKDSRNRDMLNISFLITLEKWGIFHKKKNTTDNSD
jgi:hypothetical protein